MFKVMLFGALLGTATLIAACSKGDAPAVVDTGTIGAANVVTAPIAPAAETCTWETPLEPGIPGSPDNLIPSPINPNGQSELAALMREMEAHMKAVRQAIVDGTALPVVSERQQKIRCTWPTTASDRNAAFDAFALSYDAALKGLYAAPPGEAQRTAYDGVLATCRTCHENSCPGPIMAIDALKFERLDAP